MTYSRRSKQERDRDRDRQTDRQRQRERGVGREKGEMGVRGWREKGGRGRGVDGEREQRE